MTALIMIYEPIKGVSKINSTVQQGLAAATRVFSLLDITPEISDNTHARPLPPFKRILFSRISPSAMMASTRY